jgi:26S proteasome regulatory subunit N9
LAGNAALLQQKIRLMALIELVFKRTGHSRFIPFSDIADAAELHMDQVELLIMKALSLNLVQGSIDQVAMIFHVKWVQLRVLERNQIASLKESVANWRVNVAETVRHIQNNATEFAAI